MPTPPVSPPSDDQAKFAGWCRRLQASDRDAYGEVFRAMHVELLRYAWRYTNDEHTARDVVQDVFLKLWRVRENLRPERSLKALLYTMTRNLSLNQIRARHNHADLSEDADTWEDPRRDESDVLDANLLGERLQTWIQALPERRREAFMLSRMQGLSHDEIADVMGLTPRTVNTHIVLALKDLRARLSAFEPNPSVA